MISQGSVSFPVSSFSTSRRNCSFGSTRALCNQVAQSNSCPSLLLASFANSSPVVQPPVLPGPHFAQISSQFHKPGIFLHFLALLPGQDLINFGEHELGSPAVELGRHRRISSNEARQANQAVLLLGAG